MVILQVRKAAYQSLGPFISTFYDPDSYSSPEDYLEKGSLDPPLENDDITQFEEHNTMNHDNSESTATLTEGYCDGDGKNSPTDVKVECSNCACHMESVKVNVMTSETLVSIEYSSFNFWKTPLPQVDDLDLDLLTLENKSIDVDIKQSSKTLHVHLSMSDDHGKNKDNSDDVLLSTKDSTKEQAQDINILVDNLQHKHSLDDGLSNTVEINSTPLVNNNDSDGHTAHNTVELNDNSDNNLSVSSDNHNSDERTSPILVSGVVTNELGEEIIEIREINVKDDQLTSNNGTASDNGTGGLQVINNKTQAGWGSLSSSAEDSQTDGGMISCLIPRVKITSHTDLSFGMAGVVNFDSHDDNMNFDPNDYYQKTTGSQVDMEITLDGVEESLASKQVCNLVHVL